MITCLIYQLKKSIVYSGISGWGPTTQKSIDAADHDFTVRLGFSLGAFCLEFVVMMHGIEAGPLVQFITASSHGVGSILLTWFLFDQWHYTSFYPLIFFSIVPAAVSVIVFVSKGAHHEYRKLMLACFSYTGGSNAGKQ
jgi:hypothetical protein